jgi:hypothetical protein
MYVDKTNPNILHDEITVIDNALTRPWDRRQEICSQPQSTAGMGRNQLLREQRADLHRQGKLFPERGRFSDAR